jgi:hypothetical protein
MEKIKPFIANTFIMRSENFAASDKPAMAGTTISVRTKDMDLFQFLWISIRKSLGQVVGGFQ